MMAYAIELLTVRVRVTRGFVGDGKLRPNARRLVTDSSSDNKTCRRHRVDKITTDVAIVHARRENAERNGMPSVLCCRRRHWRSYTILQRRLLPSGRTRHCCEENTRDPRFHAVSE